MGHKIITTPNLATLLPMADVLAHLKDEAADAARQAEVSGLLAAAHGYAQHYCNRSLGAQTLELALDAFPAGRIHLPMPPATAITSVKYLDKAGVEQTLSSALYTLDDYSSQDHWLVPAYGVTWPATLESLNAVKVRYTTGAGLPAAVRNALLLFVGHLDINREAVATGGVAELPMGVKALLDTEKVWVL